MLPNSFKKIDYETEGLVREDNNGQMHDIDSIVNPGDIIFFDGRKRYGVTKIESNNPNHVERLVSFAIPTFSVQSMG